MIIIGTVKSLRALALTTWASVCFGVLLTSVDAEAQTYDPVPTPYCSISFVDPSTYLNLESQATGTDPEAKIMAQFVLEAFALANANNGLLDSQSESSVVTVLNRL